MDVKHFQAWAVIFKDGEPMRLSLSRGQKSSIALARRYFGVPWKALKGRGMRCVQVTIETPNAEFSGKRSETAGTLGWG